MNILPTKKYILTEKAVKREEFLKRITSLKWDNAEVIGLIFNNSNFRQNNSNTKQS